MSDAALAESIDAWLAPRIIGMRRLDDVARLDLSQALLDRLSWSQRATLDELAPTHYATPSGSRVPIDYADPNGPVLAVRLQEMFGLADGKRDRLTDFSRPVTGALYFAPPLALLGLKEETLHETEEVLRTIPLFAGCSAHDLRFIASRARTRDYPAGAIVCTQGRPADGFFLIVDGRAEARRDGVLLRGMGPGDFFGEIALIDAGPRTATVRATTPLSCFVIGSQQFRDILGQNAEIAVRVLDAVTRRLRAMLPPTAVNE